MSIKKILLISLFVFISSFSSFSSFSFAGDYSGNPTEIDVISQEIIVLSTNVTALENDIATLEVTKADSNVLASTELGSEGIRQIGALGGYTLEEFIEDTAVRGTGRDLPHFVYQPSPATNLVVSWTDGDVYDPINGYYHLAAGTNTLQDNAVNYSYWDPVTPTLILWTTGTRPTVDDHITLGTFVVNQGRIIHYGTITPVGDKVLEIDDGLYNVAPSLIVSGCYESPAGTNLTDILFTGGVEYHNMSERNNHPSADLRTYPSVKLVLNYHTSLGVWDHSSTNAIPVDKWDNGTNLVSCVASNWYRGVFVSFGEGHTNLQWVYPQAEYTNYTDAAAADDPTRPYGFDPYMPRTTAYIFMGGDTSLRQEGIYWIDRRLGFTRGAGATGGGGSSSGTPSLFQVLSQGVDAGGLIPDGLGLPTSDNQATSKAYVDSTINNINDNKAYVDENGDDVTAQLQSSINPFRNIQTAIDAAAAVATDTERFVVVLSPAIYVGDITMSNYVGVAGIDTESTVIEGTLTYPPAFTDVTGAEVQLLTVRQTNEPALVFNMGSNDAYAGVRSCYAASTYDNDDTNKSLIVVHRGLVELYGTAYNELNIVPTNGSATSQNAQIYEALDDPDNLGVSSLMVLGASEIITCEDNNDDVAVQFNHNNSDGNNLNTIQSGVARMYLNTAGVSYSNRVMVVHNKNATGTTRAKDKITFLHVNPTNSLKIMWAYNSDSANGGSTVVCKDNGFTILGQSESTSNVYWGAATATNDTIKIFNSTFVNNSTTPTIFTNNGSLGTYAIATVLGNGEQYLGGPIDMSSINTETISVSTPARGHMKQYAGTYAGLENPYYKDSSGNIMRGLRDNFYNGFNDDATAMQVGDAVYISAGLSPNNTPKIKKSIASNSATMPAVGIVVQVGGIATGSIGRVMIMGRMEAGMNTSAFSSGQRLYVSGTVLGGLTNVAPTGTNISQSVGTCHIVSPTAGYVNVRVGSPDTIGGMTPSTIDAATLDGYTAEQLNVNNITYYIWGSLAGPYPSSRLLSTANPFSQSARTNNYTSVTNGQKFSGLAMATNELPRTLTKGVTHIESITTRTGDSSIRTITGRVTVYESDMTTVVAQFNSTDTFICLTNLTLNHIDIEITVDVPISDYNRIIVCDTRSGIGWTGTETVSFYSQDGYLSQVIIPGPPTGIYASQAELTASVANSPNWDNAWTWVFNNSNGVAYTFTRTNLWDNIAATVQARSNNWNEAYSTLAFKSNTWNQGAIDATSATNWMSGHTNGIDYMFTRTSTWDTAIATLAARSNFWDQAGIDATFSTNWIKLNSNSMAYMISRTSTWDNVSVTVGARSNSWIQGATDATFAINWIATHSNRCERSISAGKAQTFTSAGVTITNWGNNRTGGANFTTTHSNITVTAAGLYEISMNGSILVPNGDLRGVLYTNGVIAVDAAGSAISWRVVAAGNEYESFSVSRDIILAAGTELAWRVTTVSASEATTWDNSNWKIMRL